MTGDQEPLPGLDLERLGPWLRTMVPGVEGDLHASLVAGGKSNLTYLVTTGSREWVVRRPPLGHVLATAHDMAREYRVMSALKNTDVPVPTTYALCEDHAVIGATFYVMERCPGTPYRHAGELEVLGPERTRTISESLIDTLRALHRVDPEAVGLAGFGRPQGFLDRQVRRWKQQLDASYSRDLPAADELYAQLVADVPAESATAIVHGDFRLDNVLTADDGRATAVLDWEMATLGDPLTDLALLLTYHRLGNSGLSTVSTVSAAPGFLSEEEVIDRYAAGTDRDLSRFGFYLALAAFKLAAILEGIHYRFVTGQTVGDGFEDVGGAIHPLLDAGLTVIKENF